MSVRHGCGFFFFSRGTSLEITESRHATTYKEDVWIIEFIFRTTLDQTNQAHALRMVGCLEHESSSLLTITDH